MSLIPSDFIPSKRLGQNFLTDKAILSKIIEAAELKQNDIVLEIGPGTGILTLELAKRVKKVIAVEKDAKLMPILKESLKEFQNIEIIHGDIRNIGKPDFQISGKYKVVANIPYYLTSPVIRQFLESAEARPPQVMVLMVQKEVAQRICAKPPNMSLLAVSVQFYAEPKIISYVSKSCFWPKPKVDSAILRVAPINKDINIDIHRFFKIVKAGFAHPRKQLINNLSTGLSTDREQIKKWLLDNNIQPEQRAETLTVEDWKKLFIRQNL